MQAYSAYPEARPIDGHQSVLANRFYDEARRLLDAEEGTVTLSTIQALPVLAATYAPVRGSI
jgi:hypothetical protein